MTSLSVSFEMNLDDQAYVVRVFIFHILEVCPFLLYVHSSDYKRSSGYSRAWNRRRAGNKRRAWKIREKRINGGP